jgi:hypothetical protein
MRWVAHAAMRPHTCAAVPFVGNSNAKRGFIDTGRDLPGWDPHVYISFEAFQEMARIFEYQPGHAVTAVKAQVARKQERIAELEAELEEMRGQLDAVKVLKNAGFSQSNPPGRPRKVAA